MSLPANVFTVGSNADPPQAFAQTQGSDQAAREAKFDELWNAPGQPPTSLHDARLRANAFRTFIDSRITRMWQWINWARPRITFLTTALVAAQERLSELEGSTSNRPPSRPITSTSAVDARDQYITDNEELGRNVANAISRIPGALARQICEQHRSAGGESGQHKCWISTNAGEGAVYTRVSPR